MWPLLACPLVSRPLFALLPLALLLLFSQLLLLLGSLWVGAGVALGCSAMVFKTLRWAASSTLNACSADGAEFLSGCNWSASWRYAFLTSLSPAVGSRPRTCGERVSEREKVRERVSERDRERERKRERKTPLFFYSSFSFSLCLSLFLHMSLSLSLS